MEQLIAIDSLTDPRIAAYLNLKERDLSREGRRFIVESATVVKRLLASDYEVESLLVAQHRLDEMKPSLRAGVPVYVADAKLVNSIVGFKFHSGVLACAVRPGDMSIDDLAATWAGPVTVVVLPEVANTDNMGSLIRVSAAFGASAVLLGERCCDPYYRQSVRVSMGTIFRVPIVRSSDLLNDLRRLKERWQTQLIATVCEGEAEPLARASRPERVAVLLGNEAQGLSAEQIALCDRRVTIPMKLGTDSLNVSVAAGIFLYHFTQDANQPAALRP